MSPLFSVTLGGCFLKTVEISLQASLVIGVLLIIRPLIKRVLPPRWIYALWFIVVARLLLLDPPSLPVTTSPALSPAIVATQAVKDEAGALPRAFLAPAPAPAIDTASVIPLLAALWLLGATVVLAHLGASQFRWARRLAAAPEVRASEIRALLDECRSEMGIRPVRLVQLPGFASPSMTGLIHPTIVLPEDFLLHFSRDELRWILLHEMTHLKRWDLPVQFLCHMLQAIHWFNPLVWVAFACFRRDRELACDAAVLARHTTEGARAYGHALIKVAEAYPRSVLSPGFLGVAEAHTDLQERVEKISHHRRPALAWIASGIALCGLLAFIFLTQFHRPPHEATAKLQVFKDNAYVPAEIEIIQSEDVVVPAILATGLDKTWTQGGTALTPSEIMERVSPMLTARLLHDTTDVVYVTVRDEHPEEAARIANAVAQQYITRRHDEASANAIKSAAQSYDLRIEQNQSSLVQLNGQLQAEQAALPKLQAQVAGLQNDPGSNNLRNQLQNCVQQIRSLTDQIGRTQDQLKQDQQNRTNQIENSTSNDTGVRLLAPAY